MTKIKKALTQTLSILPVFLVIVAITVIGWYLLKNFGVMDKKWALPVLAGLIALSLFIPIIAERFAPIYTIATTGWTLLFFEFIPFLKSDSSIMLYTLTIISIVSDLIVNGKTSLNATAIIIDFLLSLVACIFLHQYGGNFVVMLVVLLILFFIVLWMKLQCKISSKNKDTIKRRAKKQSKSPKHGDTL